MNILFIHQNFPAQFVHLSGTFARIPGNRVVALTIMGNAAPAGVEMRRYAMLRQPAQDTHPFLRDQEAKVMRAEGCAAAAFKLKHEGFVPDLIVAHPGWGEALFIKDVFPSARLVIYCEYYYAAEGQDVGFDPNSTPLNFEQRCHLRLKNTTNLLSLEAADAAISPTQWQKSTYPRWAQKKITVIHDGIDLARLRHRPVDNLKLASGADGRKLTFRSGDEVLTYVARNLEPIRGFQTFMRALPTVLKQRPQAHAIVIGGDEISYGAPPPNGKTWRAHLLDEVGADLDLRRVHFIGKVPYQVYLNVLNVSKVHGYWTVPFVLSWSLLEAAVNGMPVLASDTPPVREFADELNIDTLEFFDAASFADAFVERLKGKAQRATPVCTRIDLAVTLPEQVRFLQALV